MLRKRVLIGIVLALSLIEPGWFPLMNWAGGQALSSNGPRIVSMAPNITETIFALGCGDLLVGVTDFCTYPPEAKGLPKMGGAINPNLEKLIALRPDLVILQGKHEKVDAFCRIRRICVLHVNMDSLSSIYRGIISLGQALHCPRRAQRLCDSIRCELEAVRGVVAGKKRPRIFICLGRASGSLASIYTAGGKSFISEIIKMAGGDNIFEDVTLPYPETSKESLIKRAPEVIIEMRPGEEISDSRRMSLIAQWDILRGIPAVSDRRVCILTEAFLLVPGPRVGTAARFIAETLHPEVKYDP